MLQPKLSCSMDDISVKLCKTIKTEIYKPITLIINKMLVTGIFPDKWKLAKVIPLHKEDDNTILNHYHSQPLPFSTIIDPHQSYLPSQQFLNALSLINFVTIFILISYIIAANTASGNSALLNLNLNWYHS